MSYPILYRPTETAFDTNGIGVLSSAIAAPVRRKLNGMDELTLQYPITGLHFSEIKDECIILAKPNPVADPQPYRIYRIGPAVGGIITVYARHLAYDTLGIPVSPFKASGIVLALEGLKANAAVTCPFLFYTDKSTQGEFVVGIPKSIWGCLGGSEGSVLDTFGGEYEFDRYDIRLLNRLGADRGVSIRYGKNLTTLEQDRNCANCHTGVYPYWADADGNLVVLPERILRAAGTYEREKIRPLDLSAEFETAPTEDQLRELAVSKMDTNQIGVPTVSWKVEFVQLEKTEEYKDKALLERVLLGDTVSVEFPLLNVSASARAVETEFDSIREHYNYVYLGSVRATIADTIVEQKKEIEKKPSVSQMQSMVSAFTSAILGANGGAVRFFDTDGDGQIDEMYVADNADPAQAVNVWRFNYEGLAASKTGYNGPFTLGMSLKEGVLSEFMTACYLNANMITAGVLKSQNGKFSFNLDTGEMLCGDMATKENVAEAYSSAMIDTAQFMRDALESYVKTGNFEEYKANVETQISILEEESLRNFTTATEQISDVDGDLQSKFAEIKEYIRFSGGTITLGASDSPMTLTLDNDKIVFMKNGGEIGSWDGDNFYADNIWIRLGKYFRYGDFKDIPRPDGSVITVWVGD